MRRIAALLVGLMALAPATASGAPMDPYGSADQIALALWIERDGNEGTMYMALGVRGADQAAYAAAPMGYGAVAKGPCHFTKRGGSCRASGRAAAFGPTDFTVDPLLSSGHMSIEQNGFTHVVDWTGRGETQVDSSQSTDEHHVTVSMYRDAPAKADLFGRKMTGRREFHLLMNGAYATSGLASLIKLEADGTFRIRIPVGLR
jgi:hypothetical protein